MNWLGRIVSLLICMVFFGVTAQAEALGFKAWKSSRVEEAKTAIGRLQQPAAPPSTNLPSAPGASRPGKSASLASSTAGPAASPAASRMQKGGKTESRLQQAQLNLDIANDLTVNDYFVLYLSQLEKGALLDAVKKMSPDEVVEVMSAYKTYLEGGGPAIGMIPPTLHDTPLTRSGSN